MDRYSSVLFLLLDNLVILVEHILLFALADMFLYRRWRGGLPLLPALAVGWLLQYRIDALGIGGAKLLLSLAMDAACIILYYSWHYSLSSLLKKTFLLVSYYAIMSAAQAASISLLYTVFDGGTDDLHANPVLAWGAYAISLLLCMLCLLFCERFRRVETVPLTARNWSGLLAMPAVSIAFVWLFFPFGRVDVDEDTLLLIAGVSNVLLCGNLLVFYFYRSIARATAALCRYDDLQRYCKHLDGLLQSESKRRDVVHDYLHNLGVIASLIESGNAREAAGYIYRLESRIKTIRAKRYTGNREVDAILSSKIPQMKEHGISCQVDGVLPASLPFDFLDVCALLSNALDNALESCVRQELTGGVISLRVICQGDLLKIEVRNPLDAMEKNAMSRHRQHRGRGLPIMRDVVGKYSGRLRIETEGGEYVFSALLQSPSLSASHNSNE